MIENNLRAQKGAAVIVALFVMALVAACAVAMMFRLNVDVQRTQLILNSDLAVQYAQGSIDWAIEQLKADLINQKQNRVIDRLPILSGENTVKGFTISSTIEDMQDKINLNDLQDPSHQEIFHRLLLVLFPKMSLIDVTKITDAIFDWTAAGKDSTLKTYYLKQQYPYQAPHKPMVSVSELRLVRGITPQIYQTLLPYVTALPKGSKVNVNDASWVVLYSLSPHMSPEAAKVIANHCKTIPFANINDFLNFPVVKNNPIATELIDAASSYFLVKSSVKVDQQQIMIYTMLKRSLQDSGADVKIVWQSKGTL